MHWCPQENLFVLEGIGYLGCIWCAVKAFFWSLRRKGK